MQKTDLRNGFASGVCHLLKGLQEGLGPRQDLAEQSPPGTTWQAALAILACVALSVAPTSTAGSGKCVADPELKAMPALCRVTA